MATPMHAVITTGQHCRGPIETPFRVSSPDLASWCTNSASLRCNCCCSFEKVGGALELPALLMVRAGPRSRLPAGSPVCWDHHRQCSEWVHMPVRVILAASGNPIPTRCPSLHPGSPDMAQTEVVIWRRMDRAEGREVGTTKEKLMKDCKEPMKKPKRPSQRPWSPDFQRETQACMAEHLEVQAESC